MCTEFLLADASLKAIKELWFSNFVYLANCKICFYVCLMGFEPHLTDFYLPNLFVEQKRLSLLYLEFIEYFSKLIK